MIGARCGAVVAFAAILAAACLAWAAAPAAPGPLLERFSPAKAAEFLDAGARAHEETGCITCHGTLAYLTARPVLAIPGLKQAEVLAGLEQFSAELDSLHLTPTSPPRKIAQTVMTGFVLAQYDLAASGKLRPVTRQALDRMWQVQQGDGAYNWLKPNLAAPSAVEDHFGVTTALIAAGLAPDGYAKTASARAGVEKARAYLGSHPPQHVHQRAMLLLADHYVGGLIDAATRRQTVSDLFALQRPEGGWAMASLGHWKRKDGAAQDLTSSDGYGTGFAVYVLRVAGQVPVSDARIGRAVAWLKSHQRASGGWYTRSPRNSDELSSYVGTVYAVLALKACGQIP
jgi:squalene-hopene/tetraprenyl-beta-curcumene cyclase